MSTVYQMVREFHEKFGLHYQGPPRRLPDDIRLVKTRHIYEEFTELLNSVDDHNLEKTLDALVDMVYVIVGYAYLSGLPFDEAFLEVHAANMRKVRCERPEDSSRGTTFDVIKPPGWVPPNLARLINGPAVTVPVEALGTNGEPIRSTSHETPSPGASTNFDDEQVPLQ